LAARVVVDRQSVLSNHAAFACMTLIASDVAKLRCKLVEQNKGIWTETDIPAFSPVLRKPNRFQNRIQFWESWILSKLTRGNTYVLKERDQRGVVVALYVLDPNRVRPLVAMTMGRSSTT
jgi:HK97 family phage portal protein